MSAPTLDQTVTGPDREVSVWRLAWKVAHHEPRSFWLGMVLFVGFFAMPAAVGYVMAQAFDALADGDTSAVYRWAGALVVVEALRMACLRVGVVVYARSWTHMQTFLRANLLAAQVASGGPEAGQPVGSAGESIAHFRDDTYDVAVFIDGLIDLTGGIAFTIVAAFVLGGADAAAAAVLILPLGAVAVVTKLLDSRIKAYRSADRAATAAMTGLIGDTMAAATTVKVNRATDPVLARLARLVGLRRETSVRDRVLEEGVMAFSHGAADFGLGLVILVSAGALASGAFDVGQLALFVSYLGWLSFLPRMVGRVLARRKQAAVAFDRMRHVVAGADARNTVLARDLPIELRQRGQRPPDRRPPRVPLARLEVVGLSARYDSGAGVGPATFTIERGQFVVITGPIGSGKSTLLRAVLGISSRAEVTGDVLWNGEPIPDRASFMVPPNAAFLPQVPQLISDTVADNIFLGDVDADRLAEALALAEFGGDVDSMVDGSDTMIGPRGLRLSGGQRQRLAAARAIVHRPELVVLDDLSSALDVETEMRLWENFYAAGLTVLAVSHRAVAFDRADQVLRLERGRLEALTVAV
jgi:ATP-binding cassette subfamily B protein